MNFLLYANLVLFLCSGASTVYGAFKFFKKGTPLYYKVIVCAWGSIALGRLYTFIVLLIEGTLLNEFNVGQLAIVGSFVFLFSVNYGCMDKETEQKAKGTLKHRLLALIAPLIIFCGYIPILTSETLSTADYYNNAISSDFLIHGWFKDYKIFCGLMILLIMQTTYFNLRHLIVPAKKGDTMMKLRGYNVLMLLYSLLTVAEMTLMIPNNLIALSVVYGLYACTSLAMIPVLKRGVTA